MVLYVYIFTYLYNVCTIYFGYFTGSSSHGLFVSIALFFSEVFLWLNVDIMDIEGAGAIKSFKSIRDWMKMKEKCTTATGFSCYKFINMLICTIGCVASSYLFLYLYSVVWFGFIDSFLFSITDIQWLKYISFSVYTPTLLRPQVRRRSILLHEPGSRPLYSRSLRSYQKLNVL